MAATTTMSPRSAALDEPAARVAAARSRVHHTDALSMLSVLPAGSVGAIITDPPFFIGIRRSEGGAGGDPWLRHSTVDQMIEWTHVIAAQVSRVLRPGGALVVMGGSQSLSAWEVVAGRHRLSWMAEMAVLWNTGKPRQRSFGSLMTSIRWYCRDGARHTFNSGDRRSIYSNILVCNKVPLGDRYHPAQKPVELTNFFVSLLTDADDLVVDPFCGSGSTLVSAAICGRPWIGADTDEVQCMISARRVSAFEVESADLGPLSLWINGRTILVEG